MASPKDFLEYKSLKSFNKLKKNVKETDEDVQRDKIKLAGDKAFVEGKYQEAYALYCQALAIDETNYDIITCRIGAALNLGYIDDVFSNSELLIKLSNRKPQGYYLKGIAHDAVFQFEVAIGYFLDALKLESEHRSVVIKSIKQTVAKFVDRIDILREEDNGDLATLLKVADVLVKHRKYQIAHQILKYIQSLNSDDRSLRLIMFKNFGKIFKAEQKYDKAIIAFEEAYYLSCVIDDLQSKIEIIASMTSCYLKQENMHKVIVYYHKLLDIEHDLRKVSKDLLNQHMNLSLRLAIRQNLFTANLRLGKLQTCCYHFNNLIEIVNENFDDILKSSSCSEFIKVKLEAVIELSKLYVVEKEYVELDKLLKTQLKFIQDLETNQTVDQENLRYYEIKLIAYLGLCAAGLNQSRLSKLLTKKSLSKLEKKLKQFESNLNANDEKNEKLLKQYTNLQVECLMIASETCAKRVEVKRDMHQYIEHKNLDEIVDFKIDENDIAKDCELRIVYAKEAFLKSRTIIDPQVRIQTTHNLGLALYDCQLYQSASYYFDETLSISKTLFKTNFGSNATADNEEFNLNDAIPDYHLESTIYWISCQILTRYTRMHSQENENEKRKMSEELESLLNKILRCHLKLESFIKLQKLNRLKNLNYLTHITAANSLNNIVNPDRDLSERWKKIFELSLDCVMFLSYKLKKYDDCVFYYEHSQYLINMDSDYITNHLEYFYSPTKPPTTSFSVTTDGNTATPDLQSKFQQQEHTNDIKTNFTNFHDLQLIINENSMPVVLYRFLFNCKLFYIFIIEPDNGVVYHNELKLKDFEITKSLPNTKDKDTSDELSLIYHNEVDYLMHKFDLYQNDFINRNLNKIENRSIPSKLQGLINIRNSNYKRDKRFRDNLYSIRPNSKIEPEHERRGITNQSINEQQHIRYASSSNRYENSISRIYAISRLQDDQHVTATNTINDNDIEISDIDIENFRIDYNQLIIEVGSSENNNNNLQLHDTSEKNSSIIKTETKHAIKNQLKMLFLKSVQHKINSYFDEHKVVSFCTSHKYIKLLVYILNFSKLNDPEFRIPNYLCTMESVYLLSNAAIISNKREKEDEYNFFLMREAIVNGPDRVKSISINPMVLKIEKENIKPRLTSNPRLAVNLLNEHPDEPYVCVDNSNYVKLMQRYDQSVSTLISETVTQTNVKRSNLEILNYYQLSNGAYKTYSIGCPNLAPKYELASSTPKKSFLANGFEELNTVSKIMCCEPVFADDATKLEFLSQLTRSTLIHITTFSSNDSDSYLAFSISNNFQPHLVEERDKYCIITCDDLNSVYLDKCKLLVLSCYSLKHHQPRFELARKFLKRGCRSVLLILTPLPNNILLEFFRLFYSNIKKAQYLSVAYLIAINELVKTLNLDDDDYDLVISSLCLISTSNIEISIDDIGKNMLQLKIDSTLDKYRFTTSKRNLLNYEPKSNFMNTFTDLEKVLVQLQLGLKLLIGDLINILTTKDINEYVGCRELFKYLTELISKAIDYTKHETVKPEPLLNILSKHKAALDILTSLGFNFQASSVEPSSMEEEKIDDNNTTGYNKAFVTYPNPRYLDLNLRMNHVFTSINDLCFNEASLSIFASRTESIITQSTLTLPSVTNTLSEEFNLTFANAISNFHALLPIEDKKLLSCLIDILALTKFSPEILLSVTDFSVDYVINYYKKKNVEIRDNLTRSSIRTFYTNSIDNNLYSNFNNGRASSLYSTNQDLHKYQKIDISNKVVNFLYSIGYEIIGLWLRFQDVIMNRKLLDYMLKILTSFSTDRDMSLYRELNVSVLGQRSANAKVFPSDAKMYSLNPVILPNSNVVLAAPWSNVPETQDEMRKKVRFTDKFMRLSKRRSNQRIDVLKHHLNYAAQQQNLNESIKKLSQSQTKTYKSEETLNDTNRTAEPLVEKLKYYPGGKPIRDRRIVNEKIPLTVDQVDQIREYSHYLCRKRLDKIDIEHNEKLEKLVLPYIANNFK